MAKSLKQKAQSGIAWSAIQKYSALGIQFIAGIILARLLSPHDYGCIGMLSIFMVLAETFIDSGFGSALIQKKNPSQEDYSTIFFWNIGVAILMYVLLFAFAPAISRFYDTPLLCPVLRVQGIILIIYAFNIVQRNQLKKKLNFKVLSIITITTSIISLLVTVYLAFKGFGVWALVTQNIITAAIPAIAFWLFVKWRPRLVFSWASFKELFSFGFFVFLTHLVNQFGQKFQGLLIGRVYSPITMGYYSKAEGTEKLASHSISGIMTQVTYPLYAEIQDDKARLSSVIRRFTMTLAYVTFPLMFILLLCAKPIFVLLYSNKWIESVPYFQVLCFAGLADCLQAVNLQGISAIGKSKEMFWWTLLKRIVGIGAVVIGLALFKMKGLLAGVIVNYWFSYFVNISLVSKFIGYKWSRQLLDLFPIAIVSLSASFVSFLTGYFTHLSLYHEGIVKLLVFMCFYLGWSFIFKPESYQFFLSIIPQRLRFWIIKK